MRATIHAATNKSEQFNRFAQWAFFGNNGEIAENVRHEQRKIVKYNHLVANMIILHNVHEMSKAVAHLQEAGHAISREVLAATSPYLMAHINRYGEYPVDLNRPLEPPKYRYKFH